MTTRNTRPSAHLASQSEAGNCPHCGGAGDIDDGDHSCMKCGGSGKIATADTMDVVRSVSADIALFAACCAVNEGHNPNWTGIKAKAEEWVFDLRAILATPSTPSDATARLVEALRPFAQCVEQIADEEDDEEWAKFRLLVKDYRRAADVLTQSQGGGRG